jgi:hypothetical protein
MVAKITCFLAMYQYQYQFWPAWQWQYQYWPYQSILIADKPGQFCSKHLHKSLDSQVEAREYF